MDILTLTFYGIVCGILAHMSPTMKNTLIRVAIGVSTGLLAAVILPLIRTLV